MADEWFVPSNWGAFETEHWDSQFGPIDAVDDRIAQTMYHEAYFNRDIDTEERRFARAAFNSYMISEYGFTVDEIFDWEAYREAYGEGAI